MKELKTAIFILAMSSIPYIQEAQEVATFNNNVKSEIQSNDKFEDGYVNVFESDSVVWKQCLELDVEGIENPISETVLYGDTLIDGVKWKIFTQFSAVPVGQFLIKGLIRTEDAKVIFKPFPGHEDYYMTDYTEETVIYDFSLEVGDNFFPWGDVTKIDSVELNDGKKHKRLHFGVWSYIEGLGNDFHDPFFILFPTTTGARNYQTFMCCHVNDELLYMNPRFVDCEGNRKDDGNANENIADLSQKVKVVYSNEILHISSEDSNSFDVKVYNIQGMFVMQQNNNFNDTSLSLKNIPKGIYIIQVVSDRNTYTQKVRR
jgi:hypothetical protein